MRVMPGRPCDATLGREMPARPPQPTRAVVHPELPLHGRGSLWQAAVGMAIFTLALPAVAALALLGLHRTAIVVGGVLLLAGACALELLLVRERRRTERDAAWERFERAFRAYAQRRGG